MRSIKAQLVLFWHTQTELISEQSEVSDTSPKRKIIALRLIEISVQSSIERSRKSTVDRSFTTSFISHCVFVIISKFERASTFESVSFQNLAVAVFFIYLFIFFFVSNVTQK